MATARYSEDYLLYEYRSKNTLTPEELLFIQVRLQLAGLIGPHMRVAAGIMR
jgi:hypothetical protein